MPTYPLPTLAVTVAPQGPSAPSFSDILASAWTTLQSIFGIDVINTADQQDTELVSLFAEAVNDSNNATIAGINNFNPAYSQGSGQDTTYIINGIQREASTNSTMPVTLVGVAGTVVASPNNVVQDENGYLWNLPATTTIPNSGAIGVTAAAQQQGAIAAIAQPLIIYTQVLGWQSATATASATLGAPVEQDGAFRQRQQISTDITGEGILAVAGALANLTGVIRSIVYENDTNAYGTGAETPPLVPLQPPHSICCVVEGGDETAIAQLIEQTKGPGCSTCEGMAGITTVLVYDTKGVPININFFNLGSVQVYVSLTVKPLNGWLASTTTAISVAIIAYLNALAIGSTVCYTSLFGPASLYGSSLNGTFEVTALTLGFTPTPLGTTDLVVNFNQAAASVAGNVVVTVL
jgi:hypothetical protein